MKKITIFGAVLLVLLSSLCGCEKKTQEKNDSKVTELTWYMMEDEKIPEENIKVLNEMLQKKDIQLL